MIRLAWNMLQALLTRANTWTLKQIFAVADIYSGAINNTTIGDETPAPGAFTDLTADTATVDRADIKDVEAVTLAVSGPVTCGSIPSPGTIGDETPGPINGTTGNFSGNVTVGGTLGVTGALTADGLAYPTSDGSAGQYMQTDGSGNLTFAAGAGGGDILADGSVPFTGDQDFGNNYATSLQNIADMVANGPSYWFDGSNDYITLPTTFWSGAGSKISAEGFFFADGWGTDQYIFKMGGNANDVAGMYLRKDDAKWEIVVGNGTSRNVDEFSTYTTFPEKVWTHFAATADLDGDATLYINGKAVDSKDISALSGTFNDTGVGCYISSSSDAFHGSIANIRFYTHLLTAGQVKSLASGGPVPYSLQGASQTPVIDDDCADDDTGDWSVTDCTVAFDTDHYEITYVADTQWLIFTGGFATETGKLFEATFKIKDGTAASVPYSLYSEQKQTAGAEDLIATGTTTASWVTVTGTFTTNTANPDFSLMTAMTGAGNYEIKDIKVKQIGCTAQYEPDGVGHGQWIDKSGNELHGTVSGAVANNLPVDHVEKYVDLTVTGDTSFTLPAGYIITSITTKETAGNSVGGGIDIGTTNGGGEIVAAHAVTASTAALCAFVAGANYNLTGADDTIYVTDADGTGWDSASIELRVTMQRIDM